MTEKFKITPPSSLSKAGLAIWKKMAPPLIEREDITTRNAEIFADVCEQLAIYRRAQSDVSELESLFYIGPGGTLCQHPTIKTMNDMKTGLKTTLRQWGLTPHDMAMLKTQEAAAGTVAPDAEDEEFSNL